MAETRNVLERLLGVPFLAGNQVRVLRNGDEIFPAMLTRIEAAQSSVDFLTYIYWHGNIAEKFATSLAAKARAGVKVRVVLDSYGAKFMPQRLTRLMCEAGVHVTWFHPLAKPRFWRMDNRTHRKVLVCDQVVAFTGGVGIASEWEGNARNPAEWRDTHFEISGPAVNGIAAAFWDNWIEMNPREPLNLDTSSVAPQARGSSAIQVIRSSASQHNSDAANAMRALLYTAKRSLIIITPYLVLDDVFLELLCNKARAGLQVTLLIPGPHIDKRFERWAAENQFQALLEASIKIFRYQKSMLHSKIMLIDAEFCAIGTANFNQRSLRKDDELILIIQDQQLYATLYAHFQEDLAASQAATDASWCRRSLLSRTLGTLVKPFKTQL